MCPKKGGGIWGEERGGAEEWDTNTSIKHIKSQGIPTFCISVKKTWLKKSHHSDH